MNFALAHDTRLGARRMNQDRLGHWQTGACVLLAVADGMGGHPHGEVAAEIAVQELGAAFRREALPRLADPARFLASAFAAGHAAILREAGLRGLPESPRTVIVACVVQDGQAHWTHVGDCRLYLVRRGTVARRTRDHSFVQQLIDQGRIREEAAASHPGRNRLLQCLGGVQAPRPDAVATEPLEADDILLLCSDGFWGPLPQRHLVHALVSRPLEAAVAELAEHAERRGGAQCDNVSVLALAWRGGATQAAGPLDSRSTA